MKIIGHRGARGLAPENTLLSIGHALDHRADEIEFDVRVTSDGIPVLSHDPALEVGGDRLLIAKCSYQTLRDHKPDLATLDSALALIDTKAHAYLEIKPAENVEPIAAVLQTYFDSGMYSPQAISIACFSQKTLCDVHAILPDIEKIVISRWSSVWAVLRARQVGTRRISLNQRWLWTGFLRSMHRRGWQISPYTVNDPAQVRKWRPYVYGIVTDYPDLFEHDS